jgi:hypothetical protein
VQLIVMAGFEDFQFQLWQSPVLFDYGYGMMIAVNEPVPDGYPR